MRHRNNKLHEGFLGFRLVGVLGIVERAKFCGSNSFKKT